MNSSRLINQTSGKFEYYTPPDIIERARQVMGPIDLDPASSEKANGIVRAAKFYTKNDNAMTKEWSGNVWLNPPFSRGENICGDDCKKELCKKRGCHCTEKIYSTGEWVEKATKEFFENGNVNEMIILTFADVNSKWGQGLLLCAKATCFLTGRTSFLNENGDRMRNPPKGCMLNYFGAFPQLFDEIFCHLGVVMQSGVVENY